MRSISFGECIDDLPLVERVVASQLVKITLPRSRFFVQVDLTLTVREEAGGLAKP